MLASELIEGLELYIKNFGDKEVLINYNENQRNPYEIKYILDLKDMYNDRYTTDVDACIIMCDWLSGQGDPIEYLKEDEPNEG